MLANTSNYASDSLLTNKVYKEGYMEVKSLNKDIALEKLIALISSSNPRQLSEEDKQIIKNRFRLKILRRKQYFLQDGDVCRYIGFVISGSMRMFSLNERGQECVMSLAVEGSWVHDYESYYRRIPSVYNIEAMEHSEILIISHEDLIQLMSEVPAVINMLNVVYETHLIAIQQRMHLTISKTAVERYSHFFNTEPKLIQRFPLHIIASYLCMTSETLSRIRKKAYFILS